MKKSENNIPSEVLAAFLDGNATAQESNEILDALVEDAELRELLHISQSVDTELRVIPQECEFIPMTAMAATCNEENYCSLECEKYILKKLARMIQIPWKVPKILSCSATRISLGIAPTTGNAIVTNTNA